MNNKPSILLVEDDPSLGYLMKDTLEDRYDIKWVADGSQVIEKLSEERFDLCLLDVMLPKVDGFTLAEEIRAQNTEIPILFVSARSMEEDRIKGFLKGGDDYITKPFSIDELKLRIEVFLKRSGFDQNSDGSHQIGKYRFMPNTLTLLCGSEEKKLTRREAELLEYLVKHANKVVKREEILVAIWGNDDYFSGRSLDVFISKLRKYLSGDERIKINNYHGVGFQFQIDE